MNLNYRSIAKATIIIVFTCIVLLCLKHATQCKSKILTYERNAALKKEYNKELSDKLENEVKYSYFQVKNFEVTDTNMHINKLNKIITNKKLCIYFTDNMCSACTSYQIDKVKELESKYGIRKLIILTTLEDKEKLKYLNTIYQTKIHFYDITKDISLPVGKNIPFVFILNKNLEAYSLYFIDSNFSKLNDIYFKNIESFFD